MVRFKGIKAVSGISIGRLFYYVPPEKHIVKTEVDDIEAELAVFHECRKKAMAQLEELHESTAVYLGEMNASIFVAQEMILEDRKFIEFVEKRIRDYKDNCAYAVVLASDEFVRLFESIEDVYTQSHVADVKDVTDRLLRVILNIDSGTQGPKEPCICAADDFNAGDLVQFDRENVIGLVTMFGSTVSHATILAGIMGIPSVVGIGQEVLSVYNGNTAILDGIKGELIIDPDRRTLNRYRQKQSDIESEQKSLNLLKGKNNVTRSGSYINVYANIGGIKGAEAALENDAGGVGLFRSEFLFIESDNYPSEDEQFAIYKQVLENMRGRKVVIRTFDLGTDKQAMYFRPEKENNPALGYRSIRVSLTQTEIFKTQLRALYRASVYGNLDIMFPMIISVNEVKRIRELTEEVTKELTGAGIAYSDGVGFGIMIETPAAVMISEELAKRVDFFSIGTNDLTQYTLAIDRQNPKLKEFYDPHHPAVIKMIEMTVENAHKAGISVDICGELAADMSLTQKFIDMGVDTLSVAPGMVLQLRKKIRECK